MYTCIFLTSTITIEEKTDVKVPTMETSSKEGTVKVASHYHLNYDKIRKEIISSKKVTVMLALGVML